MISIFADKQHGAAGGVELADRAESRWIEGDGAAIHCVKQLHKMPLWSEMSQACHHTAVPVILDRDGGVIAHSAVLPVSGDQGDTDLAGNNAIPLSLLRSQQNERSSRIDPKRPARLVSNVFILAAGGRSAEALSLTIATSEASLNIRSSGS